MPTYLVTKRTECTNCKGLGNIPNGFIMATCGMCEGSGDFECPVDLLDVLKRLKLTMEGDTDGNLHFGFVTEVTDDTN